MHDFCRCGCVCVPGLHSLSLLAASRASEAVSATKKRWTATPLSCISFLLWYSCRFSHLLGLNQVHWRESGSGGIQGTVTAVFFREPYKPYCPSKAVCYQCTRLMRCKSNINPSPQFRFSGCIHNKDTRGDKPRQRLVNQSLHFDQ